MKDANDNLAEIPVISSAAQLLEAGRKATPSVIVELPSGAVVRTRQPSPLNQLLKGRLNLNSMKLALESHTKMGKELDSKLAETPEDVNSAANMALFMAQLVCDHVLEPRIVIENPREGEISAAQVSDADFAYLFLHATGQNPNPGGLTGSVDLFRLVQSLSAISGNSADIPSTPKQFGGNRAAKRGRRS